MKLKNLCKLLVIALILAIAASIFVNLNIRRAFAESSYSVDVNSLSYEELENLTNRKTVSNDSAQITVFMHGLGCQAFHWSNDGKNNFTYQESSMPEQLRYEIGVNNSEIYVIKVAEGDLSDFTAQSYSRNEALSKSIDCDKANNGAEQLQGIYKDYKKSDGQGIYLYSCNTSNGKGYQYPDLSKSQPEYSIKSTSVKKHLILIFDQWAEYDANGDNIYGRQSNDFVCSIRILS